MTVPKEVPAEVDAAIRRLLARYCQLVDDRDYDAAVDLFTEDARFIVLGDEGKGRDAIRGTLGAKRNRTTLHQVTNIVVSNGSHDGTFHAVSDLALSEKKGDTWTPVFAGRYHDTYAGTGRDLRFTQRILTAR
jgi:3-phenylpropionate/cinnamic acid dioxygenase small subunit